MKTTKLFASMFMAMAVAFSACTNVNDPDDEEKPVGEKIVLYSENFGTDVPATIPAEGWASAANFTGYSKEGKGAAAVKYSASEGAVSIRGNQPSSGYTGATGSGNAMLAATGANLIISNIATCGAENLKISFGSVVSAETLALSYRISGTTDWVSISYVKDATSWGLVENVELKLPKGTNTINLKFTAAVTQYGARVDDVTITTEDNTTTPVVDNDVDDGGETASGSGTETSPYNVTAAMQNQGSLKWVEGYIVGNIDGEGLSITTESKFVAPFTIQTNVLIAASPTETNHAKCMPVQLPSGVMRTGLNLNANVGNLGKKVKLYGSLESYFSVPGIKSPSYFELEGGLTGGSKPVDTANALLNETMLTQTSFSKFTAYSVTGDQVWTFSSSYGAVMTGYATNQSFANEDWLISPALDLTGKTNVKLSFDHARGPAGSITVGVNEGYYTVWVSNNYNSGDPSSANWTELSGIVHGTIAWGYVSSGELLFPVANLNGNARFAFKYKSIAGSSATWEVKNVVVK